MTARVSASELYGITKGDLLDAIEDFNAGISVHGVAVSNKFDLLIDGTKRYPPIAIVGIAAKKSLGRVLSPKDFSGGESSAAFRLLWQHGFEIVTKQIKMASLDATFSVGRAGDDSFILFESRGPDRNVDYLVGLESIFASLSNYDSMLVDSFVDSANARSIPVAERRIGISGFSYPIALRQIDDIRRFRRLFTKAVAETARSEDSSGGGNPTKRVRIVFEPSDEQSLFELAASIAGGPADCVVRKTPFEFQPSAPTQSSEHAKRRLIDSTIVTRLHVEMQRKLYKVLVEKFGINCVSVEHPMASGRPADIVVQKNDRYDVYEIKTALAPRDCVRQALGQLLEYAYWPGSPDCETIWVVGPSSVDSATVEFLERLEKSFGLSITYLHLTV